MLILISDRCDRFQKRKMILKFFEVIQTEFHEHASKLISVLLHNHFTVQKHIYLPRSADYIAKD